MLPEPQPAVSAARIVEDIVGCKWSLAVLGCIRAGTTRPGVRLAAIVDEIETLQADIDGTSK